MSFCRLNRSSNVYMKKGPARHTRTPSSSLPETNIILILYFLYCPTATRFQDAKHFPIPRTTRFEPICYLMNIVTALPAYRRRAPQSTVFNDRTLLIGPAFINTHSVCLGTGTCYCEEVFMLCGYPRPSAGRATILAYDS